MGLRRNALHDAAATQDAVVPHALCPIWVHAIIERYRTVSLVRIIARKTLLEFVESLRGSEDYKTVKSALHSWFHEVQSADWKASSDVKREYANASVVGDRVVFNIKGNSYRLVVAVDYRRQIVYIKWLGTHAAYGKIDVRTVKYGD